LISSWVIIFAISIIIDFLLFVEEEALMILPFTLIIIECDELLRKKVLPPLQLWTVWLYSWVMAS
jgi:hypothetical protein